MGMMKGQEEKKKEEKKKPKLDAKKPTDEELSE